MRRKSGILSCMMTCIFVSFKFTKRCLESHRDLCITGDTPVCNTASATQNNLFPSLRKLGCYIQGKSGTQSGATSAQIYSNPKKRFGFDSNIEFLDLDLAQKRFDE
jgi:hypothetical protein